MKQIDYAGLSHFQEYCRDFDEHEENFAKEIELFASNENELGT